MKAVLTTTLTDGVGEDFREVFWFRPEFLTVVRQLRHDRVILHRTAKHTGYWGTARLGEIVIEGGPDNLIRATLIDGLAFGKSVPIQRTDGTVLERALRGRHISPDSRAMAKAVRPISDFDFFAIVGSDPEIPEFKQIELASMGASAPAQALFLSEYIDEKRSREVSMRAKREAALRRRVRSLYGDCCLVSGPAQISADSTRYDWQACHIFAVEDGGPDVVWNTIPLSAYWHWRFDSLLFTLLDDGTVVPSAALRGEDLAFLQGKKLQFTENPRFRPAEKYLAAHRLKFRNEAVNR